MGLDKDEVEIVLEIFNEPVPGIRLNQYSAELIGAVDQDDRRTVYLLARRKLAEMVAR